MTRKRVPLLWGVRSECCCSNKGWHERCWPTKEGKKWTVTSRHRLLLLAACVSPFRRKPRNLGTLCRAWASRLSVALSATAHRQPDPAHGSVTPWRRRAAVWAAGCVGTALSSCENTADSEWCQSSGGVWEATLEGVPRDFWGGDFLQRPWERAPQLKSKTTVTVWLCVFQRVSNASTFTPGAKQAVKRAFENYFQVNSPHRKQPLWPADVSQVLQVQSYKLPTPPPLLLSSSLLPISSSSCSSSSSWCKENAKGGQSTRWAKSHEE